MERVVGIIGTVVVHLIVLLLLLLIVIEIPQKQPESGVPVIMGNVDKASGDSYTFTEVKVAPQPASTTTDVPLPQKSDVESLITQNDENSVALNSSEKKKNEQVKPEKTPEEEQREREELEAERKRQEAERIAREVNAKLTGAFGKSSTMSDRGTSEQGKGDEGSTDGNEEIGVAKGVGNYGTFDLNGRSLGQGGLPRPVYNVQDEGRVVVTITVNPEGEVIHAEINSRTGTANSKLRKAALDAAKKARFNKVKTLDNQSGTITYYFKLR